MKGHRNLYSRLILHRDISAANIMLGELGATEGLCGFLIDLDMAIRIDRDPSEISSDLITVSRVYGPFAMRRAAA